MIQAVDAKQVRAKGEIIENQALRYAAARQKIEEEGLHVTHIRAQGMMPGMDAALVSLKGGMTVVYRQLPGDSFIEIATSLCSKEDNFSRKVGTVLAVEQFMNERRIRVPLNGLTPLELVDTLFVDLFTFIL